MSRANSPDKPDTTNLPDAAPAGRSAWPGGMIVALAFILAVALTWRKWPDILIDFGLQLYLPWKISTGSVLYRDVMYLPGGPLSQYYHALLFRCFGVSFRTIIFSNLALFAGLLLLLFRRLRAATDVLTATMICLGIVLVFAFNQYGEIGNYNYIAPYNHETVHGVFLSLVALVFLSDWLRRERIGYAFAAGFCSGLVFLTKPEVFAALALATAGAFVLVFATRGRTCWGFALRSFTALILASVLPFLAFLFYFHQSGTWWESLRSAGYAWVPLLHGGVAKGPYYRWCLGLDAPHFNVVAMLKQFFVIVTVVTVFAFLFRRKMDLPLNRLFAIAGIAGVLAAASAFNWADCGRALPLLDLIFCVLLCINYARTSREKPAVFLLLWSFYGFFLTAKLGLFCRIWHYGFILAMPAFASAVALLLWLLPHLLAERFSVNARLFRMTVGLVLLLGYASLFVQSQRIYRGKTVALGAGGDKMFTFNSRVNPVGEALQSALPWLAQNAPPDATLAVLPEGIMVNYLSRRTNPTPYPIWVPIELSMFGQDNMTAAFEKTPPDYIMLIHRDSAEYGVQFFGQQPEFGRELMQWIRQNYETAYLIGDEPLQTSRFGVSILKRHGH